METYLLGHQQGSRRLLGAQVAVTERCFQAVRGGGNLRTRPSAGSKKTPGCSSSCDCKMLSGLKGWWKPTYWTISRSLVYFKAGTSPQKSIGARREQVPFSKAIENGELMHECFPKHLRMGTERLK